MKPVFLIGYMGSGKTTVGRAVSGMMGCSFIDLDIYIENRYRKTVKELFSLYGEDGFRKIEKRLLEEICEFQDAVIACGGGTPCYFDNMEVMKEKGTVVYLSAPVDILFRRLSLPRSKAKRPVIAAKTDDELLQFICDNLEKRECFYEKADFMFDTSDIETAEETRVSASRLFEELKRFV